MRYTIRHIFGLPSCQNTGRGNLVAPIPGNELSSAGMISLNDAVGKNNNGLKYKYKATPEANQAESHG